MSLVSFSSSNFIPAICCSSASTSVRRRPAVILPGLGNNMGDYAKLQINLLDKYGVSTVVANVSRSDWLRNAAGLIDPNYWRGTLRPRPVLDWYLERVDMAVQEAKKLAEGGTLSLIGHSAGGWLARVYMEEYGATDISLLLTLGTPHQPPPKGPGVIDQTRGLLNYVQKNCAKAGYTPQLRYVCVAGRYIQGARFFGGSGENVMSAVPVNGDQLISEATIKDGVDNSTSNFPSWRARFVGQAYKQVCGLADVWGDGVVPEAAAHLEGALNLSLQGVYHSPVGSDNVSRPWYGSPGVLEQWVTHLLN